MAFGLSDAYLAYVIFEVVMINGVGFASLLFQPRLRRAAEAFVERHRIAAWKADPLFLQVWTTLDASRREIHFFHLVTAGWLAIAGVLQAVIHFHADSTDNLKRICLLTFFGCDVFWVGLMLQYRDLFKWTHVYGSAFTILLRAPFLLVPAWMFDSA